MEVKRKVASGEAGRVAPASNAVARGLKAWTHGITEEGRLTRN